MVDVEIDIEANDDASPTINIITNSITHLHQAQQRQERQSNRWAAALRRVGAAARAAGAMIGKLAGALSLVGPAASGLLAAGKAVAVLGKASARLTPLLAMLPALAAGFALVKGTLTLAGPGLAKAFEPLARVFKDAEGNATKLTKELQRVVGIDVRPAAAAFAKLNMPAIGEAMKRIAYQTNLVVAGFMNWTNSTRGIKSIKAISKGTADTFTRLAPHVVATATAFGDLAGRAANPAFKTFGDLIAGILDKLRAWANDTSIEDINNALKDLSGYALKIRQVFGAIRDVGRWLAENEGAVKHFSDVAAGAAIALGVATGNIPAILLGAVSLIINHWNQLKGVFAGSGGWVSDVMTRWRQDAGRIKITEAIERAWASLKASFSEAIENIGPRWTQFIAQVKAAWQQWAPLIAMWWNTSGRATFQLVGAALGTFIVNLITVGTAVAAFVTFVANAFKSLVRIVLNVLGTIVNGAAAAFGWMPGIGPKLNAAAAQFNAFRDNVNRALNGIETMKTIRINASVYVSGGGSVAGGVDQRTGNSRNAGLAAATSWMRAAQEFAGGTGGNRTGGPTQVTASVQNTILLDGRPFRHYTDRTVASSERRQQWRAENRWAR